MIKKNLKKIIISSLIILLPMIIGVIFWDKLPEQVPTHFNLEGEADGWSSKAFAVFGLPLILLAMHLVCVIGTSIDPKNKNINGKPFGLVLWIVPAISFVCCGLTYLVALGYDINIATYMCSFIGVVLIIVGNYLPKCRQNYTIGIKIPWTLNDEENWNKTHRFAGKLWVMCGIATIAFSILGIAWLFFVMLVFIVALPMVYSYILYRKKKQP